MNLKNYVLSTCKPIETYGIANKPDYLINLTCNEIKEFEANCYSQTDTARWNDLVLKNGIPSALGH